MISQFFLCVRPVFFLSLFLFMGTACTSLSLVVPAPTIESSEAAGRGLKELGASAEPARQIDFVASPEARPPNLDNPQADGTTHNVLHQFRAGLSDRWELGPQLAVDVAGSDIIYNMMVVAKFQYLGKPKAKAGRGDFSGSLYARINYVSTRSEGDQAVTFGPGTFPWEAEAHSRGLMLGTSFGYRASEPLLIYFGASVQSTQTDVEVKQSQSSDLSDPGGNYQRSRSESSYAYGIGSQVKIGRIFYLHGKLMMVHFYFQDIENREALYAAGGFHFFF